MSPLQHFVEVGQAAGLDPHPFFDTSYYLASNPDVAEAGVDPFEHFLQYGLSEGRIPTENFDAAYYLSVNTDVVDEGLPAFQHFFVYGFSEGRSPINTTSASEAGKDALPPTDAPLQLLGTDQADDLQGGAGDDVLAGLAGDDSLTGGLGKDIFVFEPGFGSDVVQDFTLADDILMLKAFGIDTIEELQAVAELKNEDGNLLIDFADGSHLTLVGVTDLSSAEFFPDPLS
ncbi:hypothetical protein J0X15_01975 [Roseibium sp. CAU 1637]|uniref:Hemolysin type calcium-binding protein n=2 Tax=Roseibium limicola TaxID=2816037 RepID=A0A939J844_9HYPH|nr:hypothetical protein [Roseibium limicola]